LRKGSGDKRGERKRGRKEGKGEERRKKRKLYVTIAELLAFSTMPTHLEGKENVGKGERKVEKEKTTDTSRTIRMRCLREFERSISS